MEKASATNEGSPHRIPAASGAEEREHPEGEVEVEEEEESCDDVEFAFWVRDPEGGAAITADEIFSNGQIRPIYPVFNREVLLAGGGDAAEAAAEAEAEEKVEKAIRLPLRRLMIEDSEACTRSESTSSSSSIDELERVPPETYCVWTPRSVPPSPERCKKSSSTGSSLRWRLRNLVVGRSHSDGKEKFVFLAAEKQKIGSPSRSPSRDVMNGNAAAAVVAEEGKKGKGKAKNGVRMTEVDMVTAHRFYYGRSGSGGGGGGRGATGGRRSFLPYKQDLVGFFANVHGLSRTHHHL